MTDYLRPGASDDTLREMSTLGLAHIGDAVFELMVRTRLCLLGTSTAGKLHAQTVEFVSARAQAASAQRLIPELTAEELDVFKRGRNAHVNSIPSNATHSEYHTATGIEALFGYLYLKGETERAGALFETIVRGVDSDAT
ncbi:MAG: ribonuclease III [Oscillospiraceae bacterium]|nr:ribonuclease III [Oscillospiraceae bacterium]